MQNDDNAQLQEMAQNFIVSDDWAELDIGNIDSFQAIVELFDKGYQSIFFSENGFFKGSISIAAFRNAPRCTTDVYKHTFQLEETGIFHSEEAADRLAAARMMKKYPWCEEFPVIDNNKKILQVMSWPCVFDDQRKKDFVELQKVEWQLVSQEVAKNFFGEKKILISSKNGNMQGFYEAFGDYLDITIFEDLLYNQHNSEILINASACWSDDYCSEQYLARELYADLLAESIVRYLEKNGVIYHYYDIEEPLPDLEKRESKAPMIAMPDTIEYRHSYHDYYFSRISSCAGVDGNIGERPTVEHKKDEHRIFLFGGCIAYSVFSSFLESLASEIQGVLNLKCELYKVINCGSIMIIGAHFTDFNILYRIMDMEFLPGDIIVHFGRYLWRNGNFDLQNHHFVRDIFLKPETHNLHCFGLPPKPPILDHFDTDANKYVAKDIYEHIRDDLVYEVKNNGQIVKSYFGVHSQYGPFNDRAVKDYLLELNQYARSGDNGFICLKNELDEKNITCINRALNDVKHIYLHVHPSLNRIALNDWISRQGLENKIYLLPRKRIKKKCYMWGYKLRAKEEEFCPLDDLYIFSHFVAGKLNIKKYFLRECDFAGHKEYLASYKEYLKRMGLDIVMICNSTCDDKYLDMMTLSNCRDTLKGCENMVNSIESVKFDPKYIKWLNPNPLDPHGRIFEYNGEIYRAIYPKYENLVRSYFTSGCIAELEYNKLIPETRISAKVLEHYPLVLWHKRVPMMSYIAEWTFNMVKDAASLILDIQRILGEYGFTLQDGHPYNIMFYKNRPIWVDITSITRGKTLTVTNIREFNKDVLHVLECMSIDIVKTRKILMHTGVPFVLIKDEINKLNEIEKIDFAKEDNGFIGIEDLFKRQSEQDSIECINYYKGKLEKVDINFSTEWGDCQSHYFRTNEHGMIDVRLDIYRFNEIYKQIESLPVESVLELACNMGALSVYLSKIDKIKKIIAVDRDEKALNILYQRLHDNCFGKQATEKINPLYYDFVDNNTALRTPLTMRAQSDVVIAMALTHHLMLRENMDLDTIFKRLGEFTNKFVVVEFMPHGLWGGGMLPPIPSWYNIQYFYEHMKKFYKIICIKPLETNRVLFVGEKLIFDEN